MCEGTKEEILYNLNEDAYFLIQKHIPDSEHIDKASELCRHGGCWIICHGLCKDVSPHTILIENGPLYRICGCFD